MSQGIWEISGSWKRQGNGPPLEPAEGTRPAGPDFGPGRLFLDFQPLELSRRIKWCFVLRIVVICLSSNKKLIHQHPGV